MRASAGWYRRTRSDGRMMLLSKEANFPAFARVVFEARAATHPHSAVLCFVEPLDRISAVSPLAATSDRTDRSDQELRNEP